MKKLTVAFLILFFIPVLFAVLVGHFFSGQGSGAGLFFYYSLSLIFLASSLSAITLSIIGLFNKGINKKRTIFYLLVALLYFLVGFSYLFGFFIEARLSQSNNELICSLMPNNPQKIDCWKNVAISKGEITDCDKIAGVINNYYDKSPVCHGGTMTTFDKNGTPHTENIGQQCESIQNTLSGEIPMCYLAVIEKFGLKDLSICDKITDVSWKQSCIDVINTKK